MQFYEKIGEGRHRDCFAVAGEDLIAKKLKPGVKNSGILTGRLFRRDVNREEYELYRRFPSGLGKYLPSYVELKEDILLMERIVDFDGSYSKTVLEHGKVANENFWKDVDSIVEILTRERLWLFDIFHYGNNIVVKKTTPEIFRPVIIDFKRVGWQAYPAQLNLIFESERRKKFYRRLSKFIEKFKHQT